MTKTTKTQLDKALFRVATVGGLLSAVAFIYLFLWHVPGLSYVIFAVLTNAFLLYPVFTRYTGDKKRLAVIFVLLTLLSLTYLLRMSQIDMYTVFYIFPLAQLMAIAWALQKGGKWHISLLSMLLLPLLILSAGTVAFFRYLAQAWRAFRRHSSKIWKMKWVFVGLVIAVPILIIVLVILAKGDPVFAHWLMVIWDHTLGMIFKDLASFLRFLVKLVIGTFVYLYYAGAYMMLWERGSFLEKQAKNLLVNRSMIKKDGFLNPIFTATVLSVLNMSLLLFVASQVYVMFVDKAKLFTEYGYTSYAEYARQGFSQLVVASMIVLSVLAVGNIFTKTANKGKTAKWAFLFNVYTMSTAIVFIGVSALYRMKMYINAYGLTTNRLIAGYIVILVVLTSVVVALTLGTNGFRKYFSRYLAFVITMTVFLILLVPTDYIVAKWNIHRYNGTGKIDVPYLMTLSAEADIPIMEMLESKSPDQYTVADALLYHHIRPHYICTSYGLDGDYSYPDIAYTCNTYEGRDWRSFNLLYDVSKKRFLKLQQKVHGGLPDLKADMNSFFDGYTRYLAEGDYLGALYRYWEDGLVPYDTDILAPIRVVSYRLRDGEYDWCSGGWYSNDDYSDDETFASCIARNFSSSVLYQDSVYVQTELEYTYNGEHRCQNGSMNLTMVDGQWKITYDSLLPLGYDPDDDYEPNEYRWDLLLDDYGATYCNDY